MKAQVFSENKYLGEFDIYESNTYFRVPVVIPHSSKINTVSTVQVGSKDIVVIQFNRIFGDNELAVYDCGPLPEWLAEYLQKKWIDKL